MEKYIKIESLHGSKTTVIEIDNTSSFKDFKVAELDVNRKSTSKIEMQLDTHSDEGVSFTIGNTTLVGREVELLREFLNQKL